MFEQVKVGDKVRIYIGILDEDVQGDVVRKDELTKRIVVDYVDNYRERQRDLRGEFFYTKSLGGTEGWMLMKIHRGYKKGKKK